MWLLDIFPWDKHGGQVVMRKRRASVLDIGGEWRVDLDRVAVARRPVLVRSIRLSFLAHSGYSASWLQRLTSTDARRSGFDTGTSRPQRRRGEGRSADAPSPSPTFAAKVGESGSKGVNHARTGRVVIHERSVGIQRSSSNALTARRCDVVSSGAIITVARRPGPPVVVRTSVARIAARSPIIARAESPVPSAIFARLTSISPSTVAKVCRRMDPSAH